MLRVPNLNVRSRKRTKAESNVQIEYNETNLKVLIRTAISTTKNHSKHKYVNCLSNKKSC